MDVPCSRRAGPPAGGHGRGGQGVCGAVPDSAGWRGVGGGLAPRGHTPSARAEAPHLPTPRVPRGPPRRAERTPAPAGQDRAGADAGLAERRWIGGAPDTGTRPAPRDRKPQLAAARNRSLTRAPAPPPAAAAGTE